MAVRVCLRAAVRNGCRSPPGAEVALDRAARACVGAARALETAALCFVRGHARVRARYRGVWVGWLIICMCIGVGGRRRFQ